MLQTIRDRATGWIAWVIVILICIPFAFWGVDSYFTNDSERLAASIDDLEISMRDFQNNVQQQKQRAAATLGRVDPELFESDTFKRKLLDKMISEQLMSATVMDEHYRISDAMLAQEIQFSPAFRGDAGFDAQKYERLLRNQGETPLSFESRLRVAMAVDQMRLGVIMSEPVLESELKRLVELDRQEREVSWVRLAADVHRDPAQVDDQAIETYFNAHRDEFRTEERVKISYLELSIDALAGSMPIDDAALREYFEANRDRYVRPEQREAAHIMIALAPDADEQTVEAAQARIADLRLQLDAGTDFVTLARDHSEDVSTAADGGNLGIVDRGTMGDEFDRVLFGLSEGDVSEPVRTEFGWHLVRITKVHPAGTKRFEDAYDAVAADYRRSHAEDDFYQLAERLADISYSHPDNLQMAADETGLSIKTTGFLTREVPADGLFANPKLLQAAFSDEVLDTGRNSEVIELTPEHVVVLRVAEHEPARDKSLADVRDSVRDRVAAEQASERMAKLAAEIAAEIRAGGDAGDRAGASVVEAAWYRRGTADLDGNIAVTAFRLPRPMAGKPSVDTTRLANGDVAVVVVRAVRDGDFAEVSEEVLQTYRGSLSRVGAETALADLIGQLRAEREIKVYADNL